MSNSIKLFDTRGQLLAPEQYNISPLESLTKDRARSPSRRSPSRNDRQNSGSQREASPKLPDFVSEVTQNREATSNIRLASPTAVKAEYLLKINVERHHIAANSKHLTNIDHSPNTTVKNPKPSVLSKKSKNKIKMESDTANDDVATSELMEKPILNWSSEDVCLWLDYIGLSRFKDRFHSQKISGRILLNLSYETLEELNLSESSEEREQFLAEVYNLQQEFGQVENEDEEMDKEIEETLRGSQENNNGHPTVISLNMGSDLTPTDSFASSRTGSDIGSSPTLEEADNEVQKEKEDNSKSTVVQQNKSQSSSHTITSSQISPSKTKSKKESSKQTSKKTKPKGKRLTRLFNSKHQSHKDPSLLHTAPPIYKNQFHNLMNTGPQGVIKVWTEMFLTDMQYVSLLVKHEMTAFDVIKLVLEKSNAQEDPECYRICEINEKNKEYVLDRNECPLQRERQWSDPDNCRFELRWRNERLIEWSGPTGSVAQDLKKKISEEPSDLPQNHIEAHTETTSSPPSSVSTSDPDSPEPNGVTQDDIMETEFAYIVQVDPRNRSNISTVKQDMQNSEKISVLPSVIPSQNDVNSKSVEDPHSLQVASKRMTSSCPDLSKNDLPDLENDPEYGNLLISKNFSFLNAENDLASAGVDEELTTNHEVSPTVNEFEYSQQLRRSSKRLSERLRWQGKPRVEGQPVEIGVHVDNQVDLRTLGDSTDGKEIQTGIPEGNVELSLDTPKDPLVGQQDLSASVAGSEDVPRGSGEEDVLKRPRDVNVAKELEDEGLVSAPVTLPQVSEVREMVKELQKENLLLAEDNRELKKTSRTFEGKSRLKERELEEMEEEKNELANQVQEMASELHSLRTANTELRTEVDEANTKLGDVDGWVTRDVFEDIRGQLSVTSEEVEKKEMEVQEIERKCRILEVKSGKIKELEVEVEKLNERIREDTKVHDGMKKDMKDKQKQLLELELETQRMKNYLDEKENEKQAAEMRLEKVETEKEGLIHNHANENKGLLKRLSDQDYEILIMREEKKELGVKMLNNIETLRAEMKKKEVEHEANIAEMKKQSEIKDESLSQTFSSLEQLVNERDQRIKQLKKQIALSGAPQSELEAKEHEYEQNKVYLKHLIALVREKDPSLLDVLNKTLSSRDSEDWC